LKPARNFARLRSVWLFDTLQQRSISMSKKLVIITVATLTALVSPALAAGSGHHKKTSTPAARAVDPRSFGNARGDAAGGFGGYPTDYLNQRFGDFQSQGRL
jgi:hypothetical protein